MARIASKAASPFKTMKSSTTKMSQDELMSLIQKKAYELWEKRGKVSGHEADDWLEAERIVKSRLK